MGETGCGKTRLIRYMCDLAKSNRKEKTNMIILKVKMIIYTHVQYMP
jgi:ABC-type glutathione transport system ATPase component